MPMFFAMHMANELLSVPMAAATLLIAAIAVAAAARRLRQSVDPSRLPLLGVMGAFVFAAQMINFTLPLMPGTSGHLGGGVLLAILLGPSAGIVTMATILIVQCLVFQDGGLLALGCNILNMGVVPCLLGWLVYRAALGPAARAAAARQYVAAWLACLVGVTAGAALVPVEAVASGVLQIPFVQFFCVMVGVHLVIALCEGAVTFAVIAYLRRTRPELLGLEPCGDAADVANWKIDRQPGYGAVTATFFFTALFLAGVASWFASKSPDGLEWCYQERRYDKVGQNVQNDSPTVAAVERWQKKWSPMADYTKRDAPLGSLPDERKPAEAAWPHVDGWGSLAGVLGTLIVLGVLFGASRLTPKTLRG